MGPKGNLKMTSNNPNFERIALIGLGLIGGSISYASKKAGVVGTVVGTARTAETRARALELGIIDEAFETAAEAVKDADLVILCTPLGTFEAISKEIAPHLKPGAIVSDVGSAKKSVIRDMAPNLPEGVHLVPGHPVAGTEESGPEAGFAELFEQRWCILTPAEGTDPKAVGRVKSFWLACGAMVDVMDASHHDLVLAITSHVPHMIAYNIVGTAAHLEEVTSSEVIKYSAGGFRDFTRIASSDPTMWRDIFLANREAIVEMLNHFLDDLNVLKRATKLADGEALFELFATTRDIRRNIVEAGQDSDTPDFGRPHGSDEDQN